MRLEDDHRDSPKTGGIFGGGSTKNGGRRHLGFPEVKFDVTLSRSLPVPYLVEISQRAAELWQI